MYAVTWPLVNAAAADLWVGISAWRLSGLLAWQDIKQRYRRSTLGPIWLTLSSAIQMLAMSFLSSYLFNAPVVKSLPFVCAGMLFWGLITQIINEGAMLFISASSYLTQIKRPLTIFVLQVIWRNVIVAAHNAVFYIGIAVVLFIVPSPSIVLWPLALILVLICLAWVALFCGIVSARYRDFPMLIQNVLGIAFWFTPLMYFPEQLGSKRFLVDYNPLAHMINLLRAPLLGEWPSLNDWLVVLLLAIFGWIGTFFFFARFRARIVYWL